MPLQTFMQALTPEFSFAGFTFPRYVGTLPRGSMQDRLKRAKSPCCGPYYHAPTPNADGGASFYLGSDFMPRLRWKWCDDVDDNINHTGWYCDNDQDQTIRGLVMTLPHGRGYLAGWSMGKGMCSNVASHIYADELDAAAAADSMAESVAGNERQRLSALDNDET